MGKNGKNDALWTTAIAPVSYTHLLALQDIQRVAVTTVAYQLKPSVPLADH